MLSFTSCITSNYKLHHLWQSLGLILVVKYTLKNPPNWFVCNTLFGYHTNKQIKYYRKLAFALFIYSVSYISLHRTCNLLPAFDQWWCFCMWLETQLLWSGREQVLLLQGSFHKLRAQVARYIKVHGVSSTKYITQLQTRKCTTCLD